MSGARGVREALVGMVRAFGYIDITSGCPVRAAAVFYAFPEKVSSVNTSAG